MRTSCKGLFRNPVRAAHAIVYRLRIRKRLVHKRVVKAECKGEIEILNATEVDVFRVPHRINTEGTPNTALTMLPCKLKFDEDKSKYAQNCVIIC
jgi:hypothetical protein